MAEARGSGARRGCFGLWLFPFSRFYGLFWAGAAFPSGGPVGPFLEAAQGCGDCDGRAGLPPGTEKSPPASENAGRDPTSLSRRAGESDQHLPPFYSASAIPPLPQPPFPSSLRQRRELIRLEMPGDLVQLTQFGGKS